MTNHQPTVHQNHFAGTRACTQGWHVRAVTPEVEMLRAALASGPSAPSGSVRGLLQSRLKRRSQLPTSTSGLSRDGSDGLSSVPNSPPCAALPDRVSRSEYLFIFTVSRT